MAALGGATYALANSVWIAFVGRGLIGSGVSFGASALHTYLGEMGTVMDDIREKQGKRPRKFLLYIALSFTINGGIVIPTGKLCMASREYIQHMHIEKNIVHQSYYVMLPICDCAFQHMAYMQRGVVTQSPIFWQLVLIL